MINLYKCPGVITLEYMCGVEKAHADGKVIEVYEPSILAWVSVICPAWGWRDGCKYRVRTPYGYDENGEKIQPPAGFEIVPEGERIDYNADYLYFSASPCNKWFTSYDDHKNVTGKAEIIRLVSGEKWICVYARKIITNQELLAAAEKLGFVKGATVKFVGVQYKIVDLQINRGGQDGSTLVCEEWVKTNKPFVYCLLSHGGYVPLSMLEFVRGPEPEIKYPCFAKLKNDDKIIVRFESLDRGRLIVAGNDSQEYRIGNLEAGWIRVDNKFHWEILPDNFKIELNLSQLNRILTGCK